MVRRRGGGALRRWGQRSNLSLLGEGYKIGLKTVDYSLG